jgi:hypothetical protein
VFAHEAAALPVEPLWHGVLELAELVAPARRLTIWRDHLRPPDVGLGARAERTVDRLLGGTAGHDADDTRSQVASGISRPGTGLSAEMGE